MAANKLICPQCGDEMNHHADKVDYGAPLDDAAVTSADFGGLLQEVHTCPGCGNVELRAAGSANRL
jgi:predicted RNA-binding Zn-ribbon protein involved in translation (DUF1610 family)